MKNDIDFVNEIMGDKEKFLANIGDAEFVLKGYFYNTSINNLTEFASYSAHNDRELKDFYDIFKSRGYYDDLNIKSVVRLDGWKLGYFIELYKKYDYDYVLCAEMLLETYR